MFSAWFEDDESNKQLVLITMLENILSICVLHTTQAENMSQKEKLNFNGGQSSKLFLFESTFFRDTLYNLY